MCFQRLRKQNLDIYDVFAATLNKSPQHPAPDATVDLSLQSPVLSESPIDLTIDTSPRDLGSPEPSQCAAPPADMPAQTTVPAWNGNDNDDQHDRSMAGSAHSSIRTKAQERLMTTWESREKKAKARLVTFEERTPVYFDVPGASKLAPVRQPGIVAERVRNRRTGKPMDSYKILFEGKLVEPAMKSSALVALTPRGTAQDTQLRAMLQKYESQETVEKISVFEAGMKHSTGVEPILSNDGPRFCNCRRTKHKCSNSHCPCIKNSRRCTALCHEGDSCANG
eukprot:ANDGO_04869.mRNA.1 hypothetical protein